VTKLELLFKALVTRYWRWICTP